MSYYHAMSLSQWSRPTKSPPAMDPSEKTTPTSRADLIGIDTPQQDDRKRISYTDTATDQLDKFICVNPYDVNPFAGRADLQIPLVTIDIPLKGESSVIPDDFYATSSSGFYGTQRKIKLEMEEFGDLSSFLPRHTLTNSIDELNTPIFEKDAFDFDISNYEKNYQTDFFVKLEYDANYRYKSVVSPETTDANIFINEPEKVHRKESIPSEIGSSNNIHLRQQRSGAAMYPVAPDSNGTCDVFGDDSAKTMSSFPFDVNDNTSAFSSVIPRHCSSSTSSYSSYPPSPIVGGGVFLSPPESFVSSPDSMRGHRKLSLDLNLVPPLSTGAPASTVVSTPSIIADVVDLEADTFNILDLVKDDNNIPQITTEDIFVGSTVTLPFPVDFVAYLPQQPETEKLYDVAPSTKRVRADDSDEDYVPPTSANKRRKSQQQKRNKSDEHSDSDSDSELEEKQSSKQKRRGRPPKRAESVCSERSSGGGSGEPSSSKYRELRDKNNEASRKSRLKRKIKELEIETEAEELATRNIKLKAQVEELERIVKSYKDNIFKIMLTK